MFTELNPLATVDEEKAEVTSLKGNIVKILQSTPGRLVKLLE